MNENQLTKKLEKKINFLTAYAVLSGLIILFFALSSFSKKDKIEKFDELIIKKKLLLVKIIYQEWFLVMKADNILEE